MYPQDSQKYLVSWQLLGTSHWNHSQVFIVGSVPCHLAQNVWSHRAHDGFCYITARFEEINLSPDYKTVVIEGAPSLTLKECCTVLSWSARSSIDAFPSCADSEKQRIIATATLLIERKFIRGCGKVDICTGELKWSLILQAKIMCWLAIVSSARQRHVNLLYTGRTHRGRCRGSDLQREMLRAEVRSTAYQAQSCEMHVHAPR